MANKLWAGNLVLFLTITSLLYGTKPSCSKRIHIAAVLPLEHVPREHKPTSSWERGLEILPGAQVAVKHINQHAEGFLPGDTLELTTINSKNCRNELNPELLLNLLNYTFYQLEDADTIGLIGAHCQNSDQLLSPFLASALKNQLFLSSAVSVKKDQHGLTTPHHYRMLQSADILIDALSTLVTNLEWHRVAVVTDPTHMYFFTFAEAVYDAMNEREVYKIAPFIHLRKDLPLSLVFQELQKYDSKIILLSLSVADTVDILCSAKGSELAWPKYAWIVHSIAFVDFSLAATFASTEDCNISEALEGVILLEHRLSNIMTPFTMGYTYDDYMKSYVNMLAGLSTKLNTTLRPNAYANLLHDSVWVLALALRSQKQNNSTQFPANIRNISFVGASGKIEFDSRTFEIKIGVDIFQVRKGTPIHEGFYNPILKQITFVGNLLKNSRPVDKRRVVNDNTSLVYTSIFSLTFIACAVGVTIILFLYIFYRNEPEIKATSVTLSLLMFLGCYIILFYMLMAILYTQSLVPTTSSFNICLALLWPGLTGFSLPLILATLLVKMLRVFRIFTHFGKVGKTYSDAALLLYVLLLISPNIIILAIWSIIDPYSPKSIVTEHMAYTEIEQRCYSKQLLLWFCILYLNIEGLALVIVIVALKTRKIRRKNFKDTKKVNAFIFVLLIVIYVINVQWLILRSIGVKKGYSSIPLHVSHVIIVVSCQGLLFVPKVLPPLQRSLFKHK